MNNPPRDLVVLVADKSMQFAIEGVLSRHHSLGIRPIDYGVLPALAQYDSGVYRSCQEFLRAYINQSSYAIVCFDRHGCGNETALREQLEAEVEHRLSQSGWTGRAAAIVFDPELDIWVWSSSTQVDNVLGWRGRNPNLRTWLVQKGWLQNGQTKPTMPKEAMQAALREVKRPPSSAYYKELAKKVSFHQCIDPSFTKLCDTLQLWFPSD